MNLGSFTTNIKLNEDSAIQLPRKPCRLTCFVNYSSCKPQETKKSYSSLLLGVNVLRRHENKHYNLLDHSQDPWIFQHAAAGWCWVEQAVLIAASVDNANGLNYGLLPSESSV